MTRILLRTLGKETSGHLQPTDGRGENRIVPSNFSFHRQEYTTCENMLERVKGGGGEKGVKKNKKEERKVRPLRTVDSTPP